MNIHESIQYQGLFELAGDPQNSGLFSGSDITGNGGGYALITDYGAVGAEDDSSTFSAAAASGKTVYIPAGTYVVNAVGGWVSNTRFIGDGLATIIKQKSSATTNTNALNIQHEGNASVANNIKNITLENFWLRGWDDNPTFDEHIHLVSVSAVTNLTIKNCKISSFRGDGIYIGSNIHGTEMHNVNAKIIDCEFDGGNNDNRNAISVIDCDGVIISRCKFNRVTRSNMPGAIDFEPNYLFNFINNIVVEDCEFNNIGGNAGCVGTYLRDIAYTRLPTSFKFNRNFLRNCNVGIRFEYKGVIHDDGTAPYFDIQFTSNNISLCTSPGVILGARGVNIENNAFVDNTEAVLIGYLGNYRQLDTNIVGNKIIRCGSTSGKGMILFEVWRCKVAFNLFDDCGTGLAGSSVGLDFGSSATSTNVDLLDNDFKASTGIMLSAIEKEATHNFTPSKNRFYRNSIQGTNAFQAYSSDTMENTWTPVLEGVGSAGAVTYTTQYGKYMKNGRVITFKAVIVCSANACTGQVRITLPETAHNTSSVNMSCGSASVASASYTGAAVPFIDLPSSKILLANSSLSAVDSNAAMTITINGQYTAYPTL